MSKKEVVVIDLGGTHLRIASVKNGKIINFIRKETSQSKSKLLKQIVEGIKECKDEKIDKLGVSCAGIIENGVIKISSNLPLKNFNLKKYLQNQFRAKIKIENDANCVALAEAKYGVKKKDFFILTLGTGIGGGIIIDGKLYKGRGAGGELGHIILNNKKDFEYWASSKAFKRVINVEDEESIKKLVYEKSPRAQKIKKEVADYIGQGIASLVSVFDPEVVVLAGGMRRLGSSFMKDVKNNTKKYCFLPKIPEIRWSKIDNPGLIGASLLFEKI